MLLPYNVDRLTRHTPWVTYGLMGANTFIFLLTILIANVSLPADREAGKKEIAALVRTDPETQQIEKDAGVGAQETTPVQNRLQWHQVAPTTPAITEPVQKESEETKTEVAQFEQYRALRIASKKIETPDDYRRVYQIQHAYDSFTDEPHYSVLNSFAYRPNEPSAINKFLSMFTAMFLHGSLDHLVGNMLFLWIFGRATEEFLGWKFYLSTYLCAGVAATLLQHIVTQLFAPGAMGVPNLGASGAIAGILGLFAVRFYRTKVRIFYLWGVAIWIFAIGFAILSAILDFFIGNRAVSGILALVASIAAIFVMGRGKAWGAFRIPSVWMIGIWVVVFNILPALWQLYIGDAGGGVAYWAHVGGFICGAIYALLIGGVEEGKTEYALEDAQTALISSGSDEAILRAGALLQKDADNPTAHEITAQGYDRRKNFEQAAHHYDKAIEGYWKKGERDAATRLYGIALEGHPHLRLRPVLLLSLASHYGQNALWNESAAILTRLVEEFPGTPEAEIALLRAAQLWMRQYNGPAEALNMIAMFRQLHPDSEWMNQAQSVETAAKAMLAK